MPSKLDLLRNGDAVEFEPGVSGRLNREKKTLELSTGEVLDAAHDRDFFPENDHDLLVSRKKEGYQKNIKKPGGEFWHQLSTQGPIGGVSDIISNITQKGDEYAATKQADREVSEQISRESPWTSYAAMGAGLATDVALTRGLPGAVAAPLLTAASEGSRLYTNPTESAVDIGLSAVGGALAEKGTSWSGGIAARRGQARALPGQQQAIKQQNIIGKQLTAEKNSLEAQEFNVLSQNVKKSNMANVEQHKIDLNNRQNRMIKMQNDFAAEKAATDAEVMRLKNEANNARIQNRADKSLKDAEYKAALKAADEADKRFTQQFKAEEHSYNQAVKNMPQAQAQAQKEYSENVIKNAEEISNAFPKESKLYTDQFGVKDFVTDTIQKSPVAGTKDANQASKILTSLFPEGEMLTGKELASRYRSLEGAIQKVNPEVKILLNDFKTHLGERLNPILADSMAYQRIVPQMQKQVSGLIDIVFRDMDLSKAGLSTKPFLLKRARSNADQFFRELTPQQFIEKFQSGQLKQDLVNKILSKSDFEITYGNTSSRKIASTTSQEFEKLGMQVPDPAGQKVQEFISAFGNKLDPMLAKMQLKMLGVEADAAKRLGGKVKKTYGMAGEVAPPSPPIKPEPVSRPVAPGPMAEVPNPNFPAQPVPPGKLPMPDLPQTIPPPIAPPKNTFIPQAEPTLPPSRTMAEGVGDFFEKDLMGGKGLINNPLTKLAALRYTLGKGALPLEAAYFGMKGLTSPTAGGEVARQSFKQFGIEAIQNWASKYPSYHDGILENPQDRRSLTKEIEDASDIPLEQKAILQSKINRGKPLESRL